MVEKFESLTFVWTNDLFLVLLILLLISSIDSFMNVLLDSNPLCDMTDPISPVWQTALKENDYNFE